MQFLLEEAPDKEGLVRLRGDAYHYLVNVRRLKSGAVFKALLPAGAAGVRRRATVTVLDTSGGVLTASVVPEDSGGTSAASAGTAVPAAITEPAGGLPPIILFQALPRGSKMDLIVRQLTEAGIAEIVPFVSERSIPKETGGGNRIERWRRIVKEARQQSGSVTETRVREALGMEELFAYWENLKAQQALGFIFSPKALEQGGFHRYLYTKPPLLVLAVGPEGGFSAAELQCFTDAGFKALSLGGTVLRTETAALYGTAAAKIILTERAWWKTKPQSNESVF